MVEKDDTLAELLPAAQDGAERRMVPRYQVDGHAEITVSAGATGGALLRGRILDISRTGCYIQTPAHVTIKPGKPVRIDFYVYGQEFRIEAICRFARTKVGIGFRFVDIDKSTWMRLILVLTDIRSRLIEEVPVEPRPPA